MKEPSWTKMIKVKAGGRDPLGFQTTRNNFVNDLFPGIRALTRRARNFVFYCWVISNTHNRGIESEKEFRKNLLIKEAAYVVASVIHQEKSSNKHPTPQGNRKAKKVLDSSKGKTIDLDFGGVYQHSKGVYGQYYESAMRDLGLTESPKEGIVKLTENGRTLAKAFKNTVESTTFYKKYRNSAKIPKNVLENDSSTLCLCKIADSKKEKKELLKILRKGNREKTLHLLLRTTKTVNTAGIKANQMSLREAFREMALFRKIKNASRDYSVPITNLEKICTKWHLFYINEYFSYAMESLLSIFVHTLKKEGGMGWSQFKKWLSQKVLNTSPLFRVGSSKNFLEIRKNDEISDIVGKILQSTVGRSKLDLQSSNAFDTSFDINSPYSEIRLEEKMKWNGKVGTLSEAVFSSVIVIILSFIRLTHYFKKWNEWFFEQMQVMATEKFNIATFWLNENDWYSHGVESFITSLFRKVISRHDEVANKKRVDGRDTFRFTYASESNGTSESGLNNSTDFFQGKCRAYFSRDANMGWRSARIEALKEILCDLNVIQRGSILSLSKEGRNIMNDLK